MQHGVCLKWTPQFFCGSFSYLRLILVSIAVENLLWTHPDVAVSGQKTLRMQTNSLTEVNPLNLTDKQQTGARVCRLCCRRLSRLGVLRRGSFRLSAAPLCSCLFTQVLLFCSYNLNFDPNFKNLIIDAFTVYYLWRFVAHLHPVSAFMFCSGSMFF